MADSLAESLERLQGLQRDLSNLSATALPNVDRLWLELQAQVDDFRSLLDKQARNEQSRKLLSEAKETLKIDDDEYSISDEFKQQTIELADELDLDELQAAKLLVHALNEAAVFDRTPLVTSIILFHQRRQYLLECLRLALEKAYESDSNLTEDIHGQLQGLMPAILQTKEGDLDKAPSYWRRCMSAMGSLEVGLQHVTERVQSMAITNQQQAPEFAEVMSFQSDSMLRQHESLGAILYWLSRGNWTTPDDLRFFLDKAKTLDRYDAILVHYLPGLLQLVASCASSEGNCSQREAKVLNDLLCSRRDNDAWALRNFQAAIVADWLAEYSARFLDRSSQDDSLEHRSALFTEALKDGAFHFLLTVSSDMRETDWFDPARKGMTTFLVQDAPALQTESFKVDELLSSPVLDRLQSFVDAYISNMPDSLRQLKLEEDEQRRQRSSDFDLHLERFLLITAYAFHDDTSAPEAFWDDQDSNLHGFLQWASQRQSTPRAAAFCEMLISISQGQDCADHAHRFLTDESAMASARLRRSSPLSWNHILKELEHFASTFRNKPTAPAGQYSGRSNYGAELDEPESELMLECYLRLIAHLSRRSPQARQWLLQHSTFNVIEYLILLCASSITPRTRACAFTALACLLTDKNEETHKNIWIAVDSWIFGQSQNIAGAQARLPQARTPDENEKRFFQSIANGFEEPNSVVGLFNALAHPVHHEIDLNDSLPFPEDLGAKYRMVGMDPYVDFVMNETFARKSVELQDPVQLRIIRLNCLTFAAMCLSTFNEDLILLANRTNLPIDSAIGVSSLNTYARMHPFARVMEWLFNDGVISALFASATQNADEVNNAGEDSPLVASLLKSLEVLDRVLLMQATYFDLVRPIVKVQSANRRYVVANSALASFEDAVLNHMDLVRILGIYTGSGHTSLATASLRLLQRLSKSRKLATPVAGGSNRRTEKSRLISALEKEYEADNISRSLASIMQFDDREAEIGPQSPGVIIKLDILRFLSDSLDTLTDRPTVAHLLLGFACDSHSLYLSERGLFSQSKSLFHELISFVISTPDGQHGAFITWMLQMKNQAFQIVRKLWRSRLSSQITLEELRRQDLLLNMAVQQSIISPDSVWNECALDHPAFYVGDSAPGLAALLQARSTFLECAATELRFAKKAGFDTLRARIQSSLFGSTTLTDGNQYTNPSIFDYLDFLDIDVGGDVAMPKSDIFPETTFDICKVTREDLNFTYNMSSIEQMLKLALSDMRRQAAGNSAAADEQQLQADMSNILQVAVAHNQRLDVLDARMSALRSWIQLAMVMLESCELTPTQQSALVLQLLQQTLPWLERSYGEDMITAELLASFGLSLLRHIDFKAFSSEANLATDTANDRLYQLFKAAAVGIQYPESPSTLRETCAQLCRSYMQNICEHQQKLVKRALQCIKTIGDGFIETVCDDAFSGEGKLRLSALLLLESITVASNQSRSNLILEAFGRLNFIQVLTNSLRDMPRDLSIGGGEMVGTVLSFYQMCLALLIRLAQSRAGAGHVMNSGFFNVVRDSGIFNIDPDIGLDIDNADAMTKYLELLLSLMRVINAMLLSCGSESDQSVNAARAFLHEYRPTMVSILKRSAGIGSSKDADRQVLRDLVDNFTLLISASRFLESEQDSVVADSARQRLFS